MTPKIFKILINAPYLGFGKYTLNNLTIDSRHVKIYFINF